MFPGPCAQARPRASYYKVSLPPYRKEKVRKAVTVEALLTWAYVREKVHLARDPGLGTGAGFRPRGFPGSSSSERIGAAVGSSMNFGFVAPADAYKVRDAVEECGAPGLVRNYALIGSRPDWTPVPRLKSRPDRKFSVADPDLRDGKGRPCILTGWTFTWSGDLPEHVDERRERYARWARAISRVHAALAGRLAQHELLPDLPREKPWQGGSDL